MARLIGGDDPLAAMSRMHREIHHLARLLSRMAKDLPPAGPDLRTFAEIQRILYGLDAILDCTSLKKTKSTTPWPTPLARRLHGCESTLLLVQEGGVDGLRGIEMIGRKALLLRPRRRRARGRQRRGALPSGRRYRRRPRALRGYAAFRRAPRAPWRSRNPSRDRHDRGSRRRFQTRAEANFGGGCPRPRIRC